MIRTKYAVAAIILCYLLTASCSSNSPNVEIEVSPKQLGSPGLVSVTWSTQGLETTTISSNPAVSGLPKTVTGKQSATDRFQVNSTTTFEIKGQTPGQGAPFVRQSAATVTVGGAAPVK